MDKKTAQNLQVIPWQATVEALLTHFHSRHEGLTEKEALHNHRVYGLNTLSTKKLNVLAIFWRQVTGNPLVIILAIATTISYLLGESVSAIYIFWMIFISIALGFWNEFFAEKTIETLLKQVALNAVVIRDGEKQEIPASAVTLGDIVLLTPGSIVPADVRLIETTQLEMNESSLTGESKSVGKISGQLSTAGSVSDRINMAFMGTNVASGWGKGLVVAIAKNTEFGKISENVSFTKPETSFQQGLSQFGNLIIKVIILLTIGIFVVNTLLHHPLLDSLLFSLAIAVGLTPELLPVIVTVSLSRGAHKLLKKEILVKQLVAIENLGNMDVLCTDKTGTLTEGKMHLVECINYKGEMDDSLILPALYCNSAVVHHKIQGDAIDTALWEHAKAEHVKLDKTTQKTYEEPLNYDKRAMFTIVETNGETQLIVKGAPEAIIDFSSNAHKHKPLLAEFTTLSKQGYRVIGLGHKRIEKKSAYTWEDVKGVEFAGYCTFLDIPKPSTKGALDKLKSLAVIVKIITGDNELITRKICQEVGLGCERVVTGEEIDKLSDQELIKVANDNHIFCRVCPEQKLRIVKSLQAAGHTVGYMGDGINDAPSLYSADVGLSVTGAVDVAKNAASVVLMRKSLDVIADGVIEGRRIFNNTIKYILMGTSSNFGNMFSAAGASFFLPFLPMQPLQILLNNGLYDLSQMTIPSDNVDPESLLKPRHWNINFIKNYMVFFGPFSSLYDFLTFGVMIYVFHAGQALFQTGWFLESLATQVLIVFVIRTSRTPFFKSRPGKWLTFTCLAIVGFAALLPFTPLAGSFGFVPLPPLYFAFLFIMVSTYLLLVETSKKFFLQRFSL